jgi:hypothetical protein
MLVREGNVEGQSLLEAMHLVGSKIQRQGSPLGSESRPGRRFIDHHKHGKDELSMCLLATDRYFFLHKMHCLGCVDLLLPLTS